MITECSDNVDDQPARGWVLFDADCSFCRGLVERSRSAVERGGFRFEPLQSPWVRQRLNLPEDVLLAEMRLLTTDGHVFGGADGLVQLAREMRPHGRPWWAWLLLGFARLPLGMRALRSGYRRVAARRSCRQGGCATRRAAWKAGNSTSLPEHSAIPASTSPVACWPSAAGSGR